MYQIYQILPTDDIQTIAKRFNTTVDNLVNINGLNFPVMLNPGNYIVVPKMESSYFETYIVKKGDNLYEIAKKYGTDVTTLETVNGLKKGEYIYPNQELMVPTGDFSVYTTVEETIENVSNKLGISIEEILESNNQLFLAPDQIIIYKRTKNE